MNPETVRTLLVQLAPLLSELLASKPQLNTIRMKGERFIAFLRACSADVQLLANAVDPTGDYVFDADALRELANATAPLGSA